MEPNNDSGIQDPARAALDGELVLERVRQLPGGEQLLELAKQGEEIELIGGAVRDVLLDANATPRELDVIVAKDAAEFAQKLAHSLGTLTEQNPQQDIESSFHERFRTVIVAWEGGQIDIATRRSESYPEAGALPIVAAGTREQDMARRDFTVNTLAVSLSGSNRGELLAGAPEALEDLHARRLRVLHPESFIDDPTRLLRLARYSARLSFTAEEHTAELASQSVAGGALRTLSGARLGSELRLALAETNLLGTLEELKRLGILPAIHPRLRLDRKLLTDALEVLPDDGEPSLLALTCLIAPLTITASEDRAAEARLLLDRLQFTAARRDRALASALALGEVPEQLAAIERPSQLRRLLAGIPPEGVALAAAVTGEPGRSGAERWLGELRHVRLQITGEDLLQSGIDEGPEIGRRLEKTLELRLDGELLDDRDTQLRAALAD